MLIEPDSNSRRILKIEQHLPQLWPRKLWQTHNVRPVAKMGRSGRTTPHGAKRSTFSAADCTRANRWHHFNASFILSGVCLTQSVVALGLL